jgi:hypothetical protein
MQRLKAAFCLLCALLAPATYAYGERVQAAAMPFHRGFQPIEQNDIQYRIRQWAIVAAQEAKPAPGSTPNQEPNSTKDAAPATAAPAEQAVDPVLIDQAKAGDPVAQYKLGYLYYQGRGIALDFAQAAVWWRKAADQGYADAQNNLGVLYNSGKGVPQSYSEAYFWENLAAARANGPLQAQFAKNRDDSASKLSLFERLRVQKRAAKWATEHPVPPRNVESKSDHL